MLDFKPFFLFIVVPWLQKEVCLVFPSMLMDHTVKSKLKTTHLTLCHVKLDLLLYERNAYTWCVFQRMNGRQEVNSHTRKESKPYLGNHSCLCLSPLLKQSQILKGLSVRPTLHAEFGKAWCLSHPGFHCKWALCLSDPCLQRARLWRCLQKNIFGDKEECFRNR